MVDVVPCGVKLISPKQVIHRIAPASPLNVSDVSTPEHSKTTLWLQLFEAAIVSGNYNIYSEHHLDPDGESNPLDCHHYGLCAPSTESKCVDTVFVIAFVGCLGVGPKEFRHV